VPILSGFDTVRVALLSRPISGEQTMASTAIAAQNSARFLGLYRPGTGTMWLLANHAGTFSPIYHQGDPGTGIGGYDMKSSLDRAFAFDYDGSGAADHIALYRPGTGTFWVLKSTQGNWSPVYNQGDPGNGVGGYDLKSGADRAFAFDYDGSGKLDHVVFYRPGTGTMWILKNDGGTFTPVYNQGDPGNGIGGYDLKSGDDRAFAFDYDGSGKLDHLALYRPGTGTMWILRNDGGTFTPVYQQGDPGNGIGGYDLKSGADRAFAFDYDGSGKLDHLALYRPGTGTMWILKNDGGTFTPVYNQGDPGNGIGGYDLKSSTDRAFAFDYDGSGKSDHLALYRPGTGTMWILRNNGGTFTPVYQQGDPGIGIGGYDLKSGADRAFTLAITSGPAPALSRDDLLAAIASHAPTVKFHPQEQYLPCSVDWLLENSWLCQPSGKVQATPDNLPSTIGAPDDHKYWLELKNDGIKPGNLSSAVAYLRAKPAPGKDDFTDISFWFCYAYNGAGTAHLFPIADRVALDPFGEHYGDWETCTLRINNATKALDSVYLSQHAGGEWVTNLAEFTRENGRIVVYASRNGHASYKAPGSNPSERTHLPAGWPFSGDIYDFSLINECADGGPSLDCSTRYALVSADYLGQQAPQEPAWLNFGYRWGPEIIYPAGTLDNWLKKLGVVAWLLSPLTTWLIGKLPGEMKGEDGPTGPRTKASWNGAPDA
jgi:ribosomal protein L24E